MDRQGSSSHLQIVTWIWFDSSVFDKLNQSTNTETAMLSSQLVSQSEFSGFFFFCQIRSEKANRETVTLSRYGLSHQSITKHLYYMYNFGKSQEITRFFWEKKVMKVGIWRSHSSFPHKVTLIVFFFKRRGWPIDHRGWCGLVFFIVLLLVWWEFGNTALKRVYKCRAHWTLLLHVNCKLCLTFSLSLCIVWLWKGSNNCGVTKVSASE